MYYDRFGNVTREDLDTARECDIRVIHTGRDKAVVGEPTADEVTFRAMLDNEIIRYRLRIENGWLKDAELTKEDRKELLKD
jgi:hypothetical protein